MADADIRIPGPRMVGLEDLNSIQLIGYQPDFRLRTQPVIPAVAGRSLFQLHEVGRAPAAEASSPHKTTINGSEREKQRFVIPPETHILSALHGANAFFAFSLSGFGGSSHVAVGTLDTQAEKPAAATLIRFYRSRFGPLRTTFSNGVPGAEVCTRFGLALGFPHQGNGDALHGNATDMLIRTLAGESWCVLILAAPVEQTSVISLRVKLLDDLRRVEATTAATGMTSRLAQSYVAMMEKCLADVNVGMSIGLWRVATYLSGTNSSYGTLAAMWRGLYTGPSGEHCPVRVLTSDFLRAWIANWVLPSEASGNLVHPFTYQTLLTSAQLASLTTLPLRETCGFARKRSPRFDVAVARAGTAVRVGEPELGTIEDAGIQQGPYLFDVKALRRHAFVCGVTGSGKTNTLFRILRQVDQNSVPFLILEPAKSEYRALVADGSLRDKVRVFTIGDERVAPLRLNPFEVVGWPMMPVSVHIDLLRSCFAASFGLWTPLPQILEQCLYAIYKDRGWNIISNTNARLPEGADPSPAFPSMADLSAKVDVYTSTLGYDDRVRADLRAALVTRVQGLRIGGKGAMFDTQRSTPMVDLLSHHTVLELQNLGDDEDKAFFMALLFTRLVEHRRAAGPQLEALEHVVVIEEAHRLLTNVSRGSGGQGEQADPKGKAVESFSNLISEIRAYGQGLIVVDQVPNKLAPDVIKNTNVKIVHRIVAEDDRSIIAGATAMNDEQKAALAILGVGKAVVFEDGEDGPILVSIPRAKDLPDAIAVTDEDVKRATSPFGGAGCPGGEQCSRKRGECSRALTVIEEPLLQRTFAKLVLSLFSGAGAFERLMPDVQTIADMIPGIRSTDHDCLLTHLSHALAERWGKRLNWSFPSTHHFGVRLTKALSGNRQEMQQFWTECGPLLTEGVSRCIGCRVSADRFSDGSACSVRMGVDDLVDSGVFSGAFADAARADEAKVDNTGRNRYAVCNDAAFELIEFPASGVGPEAEQEQIGARARRALLCFATRMLERRQQRAPLVLETQLMSIVGDLRHE